MLWNSGRELIANIKCIRTKKQKKEKGEKGVKKYFFREKLKCQD